MAAFDPDHFCPSKALKIQVPKYAMRVSAFVLKSLAPECSRCGSFFVMSYITARNISGVPRWDPNHGNYPKPYVVASMFFCIIPKKSQK